MTQGRHRDFLRRAFRAGASRLGGPVDLVPGTVELMAMKAVTGTPRHGFGIARWIEDVTGDRLSVDEGALYPALHRLERRGWLASDWAKTEHGRRARYYRLTAAGRAELERLMEQWSGSIWALRRVLEADQ